MTIAFLFQEFVLTASDIRALEGEDELEEFCMSLGGENMYSTNNTHAYWCRWGRKFSIYVNLAGITIIIYTSTYLPPLSSAFL